MDKSLSDSESIVLLLMLNGYIMKVTDYKHELKRQFSIQEIANHFVIRECDIDEVAIKAISLIDKILDKKPGVLHDSINPMGMVDNERCKPKTNHGNPYQDDQQ